MLTGAFELPLHLGNLHLDIFSRLGYLLEPHPQLNPQSWLQVVLHCQIRKPWIAGLLSPFRTQLRNLRAHLKFNCNRLFKQFRIEYTLEKSKDVVTVKIASSLDAACLSICLLALHVQPPQGTAQPFNLLKALLNSSFGELT